jgi:hypothetical protein
LHPVVVPFCAPCRIAASHEFERVLPFQVKVSVWLWRAPWLVAVMTNVSGWLYGTFVSSPPFPIAPGSATVMSPEVIVPDPLRLPPIPDVSAEPSQPDASFNRPSAPTRDWLIVSR